MKKVEGFLFIGILLLPSACVFTQLAKDGRSGRAYSNMPEVGKIRVRIGKNIEVNESSNPDPEKNSQTFY